MVFDGFFNDDDLILVWPLSKVRNIATRTVWRAQIISIAGSFRLSAGTGHLGVVGSSMAITLSSCLNIGPIRITCNSRSFLELASQNMLTTIMERSPTRSYS